jgi:hypothetical protein
MNPTPSEEDDHPAIMTASWASSLTEVASVTEADAEDGEHDARHQTR